MIKIKIIKEIRPVQDFSINFMCYVLQNEIVMDERNTKPYKFLVFVN